MYFCLFASTINYCRSSLKERVFDCLLDWIILDHQALRAPEHPALRKAFQIATGKSSFEVGGRKKFRRALMTKKDEATQALKEMLKGTSPAATTDIWTSNSNVSLESSRIINNSMPDQNHSKYHTTYQLPVRIILYNIW